VVQRPNLMALEYFRRPWIVLYQLNKFMLWTIYPKIVDSKSTKYGVSPLGTYPMSPLILTFKHTLF
jgi:hypothetical protein